MSDSIIEVSGEAADMLIELSLKEGSTKAEILRRSLGLYHYVSDKMYEDDATFVSVIDDEDRVLSKLKWRR